MAPREVTRRPTGRRVVTMLVAVLLAAGCVVAGIWQWTRHQDRATTADLVASNFDADPVAVADLLPGLAAEDVWRPVTVVGRYVDEPVALRGRPVDGSPAVHELALLEIAEGPLTGDMLVVNRGWLPLAPDEGLPAFPARPDGVVDVVVRLRPLETASDRSASEGETFRVAAADLGRAGLGEQGPDAYPDADPDAYLDAYGVVVTEDGEAPLGLSPLPRPEPDLGVNLSYAFQWWLFAVGALVGGVLLLRQPDAPSPEQAESAEDGIGHAERPSRTRAPARRRPTAEDEEDALVAAQEAATRAAPDHRVGR